LKVPGGTGGLESDVMQIQALGHVVLRVTDRARSERFYGEVLGLPICARYDENGLKMAFFTLGNHHDFAVMEVSGEGSSRSESAVGLHHVAFKIGSKMEELLDAKAKLEAAGLTLSPVDHDVTKSLYFEDPDGNGIEVYIDASDAWRREPQRVAHAEPMTL
jgi:catechol 2,3-dioxygenase